MYCFGPSDVEVRGEKAERVRYLLSKLLGDELGGGDAELKPLISHKTMQCSLNAFERIRSPWKVTLKRY